MNILIYSHILCNTYHFLLFLTRSFVGTDVELTLRGSGLGLGIIRVLGLELPHSVVRSAVVFLADVLQDQPYIILRLVGQVGQILNPVRQGATGLDT